MTETLTPAVYVSEAVREQAFRQVIEGFDPNPPHQAKLAEITNSAVATDGLVTIIERGQAKSPRKRPNPVFFDGNLAREVDIDQATQGRSVLRIQIPDGPIRESELSSLACSRLLQPTRDRDFYRLSLPGMIEMGVGTLALMSAVAAAILEQEPPYPITTSLGVVAGLTLAVGGVTRHSFKERDRRLDMIEWGAAPLLSPIIVRHAAETPKKYP